MSQSIITMEQGDLIRRRAETKWHYGVYFGSGYVFDTYPPRGEGLTRFEDFKKGEDVLIEARCSPEQKQTILERIRSKLAKPKQYNLLTDNCEHVSREVVMGVKTSYQLGGAVLGILTFVFLIWLLNRK